MEAIIPKLKVGVWVNSDLTPEVGGGYQYYSGLLTKLNLHIFTNAEIIFLSNSNSIENLPFKKKYAIKWRPFQPTSIKKSLAKWAARFGITKQQERLEIQTKNHEQSLISELGTVVDLIYYPTTLCQYPNFPYVYTIWDLGHLSTYAFPELSMNGVYELRETIYSLQARKALMVIAESNAGKDQLVRLLQIAEQRIAVVPLFAGEIASPVLEPIRPELLNDRIVFVHYPAQFWAHKNHFNLLLAFKSIENNYPDLKLVFTGADKGNKSHILHLVKTLQLYDRVIDLGFVKNQEMKWIYLHSKGLVMPTFLGPTNMPLLEAASLNCPVACSDLTGHQEQLGDYAFYFNPIDPESIANAISMMLESKQPKAIWSYKEIWSMENAMNSLDIIWKNLSAIRSCWGSNQQIY